MEGIYSITCTVTERVYIGRSMEIEKRWKKHLDALRGGRHNNKQLLKDYQDYGEDSFVFKVEKETDNHVDNYREESYLFYQLKENGVELYNIAGIVDYRSITKEESIKLGEDIINRTVKALTENDVERHDWQVGELAEQLNVPYNHALIGIREYFFTDYKVTPEDKYSISLFNDYTEYHLSFIPKVKLNKNVSIGI